MREGVYLNLTRSCVPTGSILSTVSAFRGIENLQGPVRATQVGTKMDNTPFAFRSDAIALGLNQELFEFDEVVVFSVDEDEYEVVRFEDGLIDATRS